MAAPHRLHHPRAQRIHQAQKPKPAQPLGLRRGGLLRHRLKARALRQRQHPQPLARQRSGLLQPIPLLSWAQGTHRQHPLRRALHQHGSARRAAGMKAGSKAVFGLKRNRIQLWFRQQGRVSAPPLLAGELEQGHIGGIAAPFPEPIATMQIRFVAQHRCPGQPFQANALRRPHLLHRQLIAGERAGFIARDQGAAPQPLHRR